MTKPLKVCALSPMNTPTPISNPISYPWSKDWQLEIGLPPEPLHVDCFLYAILEYQPLSKVRRVFNREKFSRGSRSYLVVTLVTLVMSICYK